MNRQRVTQNTASNGTTNQSYRRRPIYIYSRSGHTFRQNGRNEYDLSSGSENNMHSYKSQTNINYKVMPYKRLEEFINKYADNPTDLYMNIKSDKTFLNLISNDDRLKGNDGNYSFLCNALQALFLITDCDRELLFPYFEELNSKNFEKSIIEYLRNFHHFVNSYQNRNRELHLNAFKHLIKFLRSFQIVLQKPSMKKVSLIMYEINKVIESQSLVISQESIELIKEMNSYYEDLDIKSRKNNNSFRNLSIFPTNEDMHTTEWPLVHKNIIKGKYDSVDHYLEVQFRLLREDFIRPLREGINEYLEQFRENKPIKRLNDIRIYTGVKITGSQFRNGLIHSATFNIKDYKHIRWQNSKQLIYGSMLCLTSDNFKTFCFATVTGKRDPKLLSKGIFQLKFENQSIEENIIEFTSTTLVMAEAQAYFEAYRHNLLALQQFKPQQFPLEDYLINVSTNIKYLSHLNRSTIYDLSDLALNLDKMNFEKMKSIIDSLSSSDFNNRNITFMDKLDTNFNFATLTKQRQLKNVNVMSDQTWPKAELLGVDDSQYEAIKAALTREMVVIQGPPGTGKTYVGLRIVQILLRNKQLWNSRRCSSPILIVCYTNHALDQFLEGMIPFCKIINGMVRIGGRSQSELLERFSLTNMRKQLQTRRLIPFHIYRAIRDARNELQVIQNDLSSVQSQLEMSRNKILGNKLEITIEAMKPTNKSFILQLKQKYDDNFGSALIKWLSSKVVVQKIWFDIKVMNEFVFEDLDDDNRHLLTNYKIEELKNKTQIKYSSELSSYEVMSVEDVKSIRDVTQLSQKDRWLLYRFWRQLYRASKREELNELNEEYDETNKCLVKLKASRIYYDKDIGVCEQKLKFIKSKLSLVESEIIESRKKVLGSELKSFLNTYENNSNNLISRLLKDYNKNFDLAIIEWLTNKVVLKDVWVEVEKFEDSDSSDVFVDNVEDTKSSYSNDSESEEELEFDEEEVENILNVRIIEDEHYYETSTNHQNCRLNSNEQNSDFGFVVPKKRRLRLENQMKHELSSNDIMSDKEVETIQYISSLSTKDRWRLYRYWRQRYCQEIEVLIKDLNKKYAKNLKLFERLRLEEDLFVIKECDIIGLTTTGAAKFRSIIEQIDPLIVVVEEAAEVLESHVVTSLTKSTKHLILIGDHQQLRPNPSVYDLAKNYNLEVSLFERMIINNLPFHQLKVQHRMKPCISSLLVPHIYKELRDHDSVQHYEDIRGVSKSLFFIDHRHRESLITNENKSKKNEFEAKYIVAFCKYLILQQYQTSQITILTMYSAQLFLIKQLMKSESILNGVRATVLDNYQGEECDIILISFVRSNTNGGIGFLKVPNRVNVALSRARMGMFCIANFDCLSNQSKLWNDIKKSLFRTQEIGSTLELFCQNHPKNKTIISKVSDFEKVPEGGCLESCSKSLSCGHKCPLLCHVYDKEHKTVKCIEKCRKMVCELQHKCKNICHYPEKCKPCTELVVKTIPLCGHKINIKCSTDPSTVHCKQECEKTLLCGHKCTQFCGNDCVKWMCNTKVTVESKCGHRVKIECHKKFDVEIQLNNCKEKCDTKLQCLHICRGSCGDCHQKRLHVFCKEKCIKRLSCGHSCNQLCGQNCKCKQNCQSIKFKNINENQRVLEVLIRKVETLIQEQTNQSLFRFSNQNSIVIKKLNNLRTEAKRHKITETEVSMIGNKLEMIERIVIFKQLLCDVKYAENFEENSLKKFTNYFNLKIDQFMQFVDKNYSNNLQQISDSNNEINRFVVMSEILRLVIENQYSEDGQQLIIEAFDMLSSIDPFNDYIELKSRLLISYAQKYKVKQLELMLHNSPNVSIIERYFENSRAHSHINVNLKSIKRYNNIELKNKFLKSFSKDNRMLLWHGTLESNLDKIYEEGLKLPSHGGMFGRGIYFADRVTKSVQYTDCLKSGTAMGTLLLCEVAVGEMFEARTANPFTSPPIGYQSVKGIGNMGDISEEVIIENKLLVPLGKTVPNVGPNSSLIHNEYVIYDPQRVLIRFVIQIEKN